MDASHDSGALLAHVGWVRALAGALVQDSSEADDLAQETLATALERGPRDPGSWRAWARAVLHNALAARRRSSERRSARELHVARSEALPSVVDDAARLAEHRRVVAAVEALDEPFRTVVLLRWFDDLPPRAIAARLGVPVKTVNSRLTRAHARLRERLEAEHGDRERSLRALALLVVPRRAPRGWRLVAPVGALAAIALLVRWAPWQSSVSSAPALVAGAANTPPETERALATPEAPPQQRDAIAPTPAEASVSGRVLDETGTPVAGATVELHSRAAVGLALRTGAFGADDRVVARTRSDARGEWRAEIPARGALELEVRAPGRALTRVESVVAGETLETLLEPAAELALACRDERGEPLGDATIELRRDGAEETFLVGRTDARGAWRCNELPPGAWSVLVRPALHAGALGLQLGVRAGEAEERTLVVPDGAMLTGAVRAADQRPIAGAEITLAPDGHVCARTDERGRFALRGLDARRGAWDVRADAPGFASASRRVTAAAGGTNTVELELGGGWHASGRVLDADGNALEGAWVVAWAHRQSGTELAWDLCEVRSAADGSFRLADLRPDMDYGLLVRAPGRGTELAIARRAPAGSTVPLAPIVLRDGARLSGSVHGSGSAGALVRAELLDLPGDPAERATPGTTVTVTLGAAISASDGGVDLELLANVRTRVRADGTFRFVALAPGHTRVSAYAPAAGMIARAEVELAAGAERAGIELAPTDAGVITGRVLDPDHRPLAGAWVLLFREGEHLERRSSAVDADGRFRFEGLEPGLYSVTAIDQSKRAELPFARRDVGGLAPGGGEVDVVLGRSARLAGTVVDVAGNPLAGALVEARDATGHGVQSRTDASGNYTLIVAADGVFTLEASWSASNGDAHRSSGRIEDAAPGAGVIVRVR